MERKIEVDIELLEERIAHCIWHKTPEEERSSASGYVHASHVANAKNASFGLPCLFMVRADQAGLE